VLLGINRKLKSLLPVGMFFGVQLVVVKNGLEHALLFNAGMPDTLLVDGTSNRIKQRYKSKGLPLGIVDDINPKEIVQYVPIKPNDKILMFSDGLTEARSTEDQEFGEDRLEKAINKAAVDEVYNQIFTELDRFCGDMTQADDVNLVELNCVDSLLPKEKHADSQHIEQKSRARRGEWNMVLNFKGSRLRETNPVPIVVNQILELEELEVERQSLFTAITELYVNALDNGVLGLDYSLKHDAVGFVHYFKERNSRLEALGNGPVVFDLCAEQSGNTRCIVMRVEDSGNGFDYRNYSSKAVEETRLSGRGILLIKELCKSLTYEGKGNIAVARFEWNTG
jgi:hypothetical protein